MNGFSTKRATLTIRPGKMTLSELRLVYSEPVLIELADDALTAVIKSVDCVAEVMKIDKGTYGINTGIGRLASTRIEGALLEDLQRAIVLSHVAGVGPPADDDIVRLIIVLKINSLARGFSGVRPQLLQALIALVNAEVYPHIPIKGSVGASGDLAPLSHMCQILLGEGKARHKGRWLTAAEALSVAGLSKITLGPKEGVALINGTQVSSAFALQALFEAEDLFASAIVIGSLTVEAAFGSRSPFDERIQELRGYSTQKDAAAAYRYLLKDRSEFSDAHRSCTKVQDPYSLRCQPQVMGACLNQIRNAVNVLTIEANAVSDNPLVFADSGEVLSGGNFHAEPIAMAADGLALALAEIGSLSERRTAMLMDKNMSQLPPFLVEYSGVNSGFMTVQTTSAALCSENKCLAHPACVDSIPTSANQEDHVSMAPAAGRRLWEMAENLRAILAIEWLAACQGMDLRPGLRSTNILEQGRRVLRERVTFLDKDRAFSPDIEVAVQLLADGKLAELVPNITSANLIAV